MVGYITLSLAGPLSSAILGGPSETPHLLGTPPLTEMPLLSAMPHLHESSHLVECLYFLDLTHTHPLATYRLGISHLEVPLVVSFILLHETS